ncbi:FtsX-like permease family protein [Phycisphaera mikurensis]|uniref:Putative ABC transporter permease protein n=1 Tax=Phycisphaera mikurensis (strain NBRC 102666 / KCTC 22515 / FYK2301M01) TaxID=1142394 RepID=I0IIM3_PHYMF|nr:ABC transporter permease [Phycisphaera mikurensis]MBB6442737.1 putative ABC transport system permease protein [Phycisphaera mikurensis]BAM05111.1 putative ABC transporter permease protein [Phycisphaera mikurensis NBRC 102666]
MGVRGFGLYRTALRMLLGDRVKCLGLVFGVALSTLLICQQVSIFVGLLGRASSAIDDVTEADVWVMDPAVKTVDVPYPLRNTALQRVRGVEGVAWAVPFFKAVAQVRTRSGTLENALIFGADDASLVGVPDTFVLGRVEDLMLPEAIAVNPAGFRLLFPGEELDTGRTLELNDRRAKIVAIVDAAPAFAANLAIYTRYSLATAYTNNGRNSLSFVLVKAKQGFARATGAEEPDAGGADAAAVAARITADTDLKAEPRSDFKWMSIAYILANTGIPVSFGTVVILGVVIGIAIVGLTFNQFVTENLKQYAALKAIGVRNAKLLAMTLFQAAFVGTIGYALGLLAAACFFSFGAANSDALRGFYLLPSVAAGVAVLAALIVVVSTVVSMRRVLTVDPATVFRG